MKKIILLILLFTIRLTSFGQDIFVASVYSDNGREYHLLETAREYTFYKEESGRVNFTISSMNKVVLDTYLTKATIVKTSVTADSYSQTRLLTVVDKKNTRRKYYYLFTIMAEKEHSPIRSFIITSVVNNVAKRSYLGKPN